MIVSTGSSGFFSLSFRVQLEGYWNVNLSSVRVIGIITVGLFLEDGAAFFFVLANRGKLRTNAERQTRVRARIFIKFPLTLAESTTKEKPHFKRKVRK